jgi:poly-gamma-glutamate capsule biosynthesis protein CapA/YwtB (metallophosphatase superfamily)
MSRSWTAPGDIHPSVGEFAARIDLSIANLECPLSGDETHRRNKLTLHASSNTIELLKTLKVEAVTLANNHIADYGAAGGQATVGLLEQAGIQWFGAGYAGREGNPAIVEKQGLSFACVGYSHPPCDAIFSSPETFGSARYSREEFERLIPALKAQADFVLVFMHWGTEDVNYPVPENRVTARDIIDLGADAVIGAHPHVYQGYERYKGKHIVYSLGNFIFGDIVARARGNRTFHKREALRARIGLIPIFSVEKSGMRLDAIRFVHLTRQNALVMLSDRQARWHEFYVGRLARQLTSMSLADYERWWQRNIRRLALLAFVERAMTNRMFLRPGVWRLRGLRRILRQDVDALQTNQWKQ